MGLKRGTRRRRVCRKTKQRHRVSDAKRPLCLFKQGSKAGTLRLRLTHSVKGLSTDLFEKVWEDREFIISMGRRERDGLRVLLLVPSPDSPLSANTAPLRHACALRDELDSSWAARPLELVEFHGQTGL